MNMINNTELWRYPRFFTDSNMSLSDEDLRHAKQVLRMKRGDKAILCDGNGTDYLCEYTADSGRGDPGAPAEFRIIESMPNQAEPSIALRLFQCLPKSDKMDFIVQKAVELGAAEIIPVVSARCVSRPDSKSFAGKRVRWNKIAYEAAKQCGRGKIPVVGEILGFREAIRGLNSEDLSIIFYECGGKRLSEIPETGANGAQNTPCVNVIIGSEGGFEKEEIEFAETQGAISATLGKRILRVDTASIAAISVIMNATGNF
jgi:16S rRNA (uracil1498-N3)-methyltransferase